MKYSPEIALQRRFTKEKKALVPKRDYLDGHPFEDKIRKVCFKAGLVHQGHNAAKAFNNQMTTPLRTIVSKTYTDMFSVIRNTSDSILTDAELDAHADYIFEVLEAYQQEAKALVLAHLREVKAFYNQ